MLYSSSPTKNAWKQLYKVLPNCDYVRVWWLIKKEVIYFEEISSVI